jgi:hypothetical protein
MSDSSKIWNYEVVLLTNLHPTFAYPGGGWIALRSDVLWLSELVDNLPNLFREFYIWFLGYCWLR